MSSPAIFSPLMQSCQTHPPAASSLPLDLACSRRFSCGATTQQTRLSSELSKRYSCCRQTVSRPSSCASVVKSCFWNLFLAYFFSGRAEAVRRPSLITIRWFGEDERFFKNPLRWEVSPSNLQFMGVGSAVPSKKVSLQEERSGFGCGTVETSSNVSKNKG